MTSKMITEFLEEQAAQFVSGSLPPDRLEQFELLLLCHEELRDFTMGLAETTAPFLLPKTSVLPAPSADLRAKVLAAALEQPQSRIEAIVRSDRHAVVQWVDPVFSEMCGYSLEELKGRKLGPLLQGEKTDPQIVWQIREAIRTVSSFHGIILNYHKDGHPYWVEVTMTPIRDDTDQPIYLIAREYERKDLALP